jgi:hypothetical protein
MFPPNAKKAGATSSTKTVRKAKIALMHVAKKELGWSDEVYRHVLRDPAT